MKCPMCGKGIVCCVGPWKSCNGQFGLGFNMKDGRTCCSLRNRFRGTREQAQELAESRPLESWMADEDMGWEGDQEDIIGPQDDGDPYDKEPLQF